MWSLIVAVQLLALELPRPLELGQDGAEMTLIAAEDTELRRRLMMIAADPAENLVLHLHGVESDGEPRVSWEIYVASSAESDCDNAPALVGILSLYGARPNAEFLFPLDSPVVRGEPVGLKVIFRPISGLEVDGEPVRPTVRGVVRIGGISVEIERAEDTGKNRSAR